MITWGITWGAARVWARPEVRDTWGCIARHVSPTRGITVKPQGGPFPPRVRATVRTTYEYNTTVTQFSQFGDGQACKTDG